MKRTLVLLLFLFCSFDFLGETHNSLEEDTKINQGKYFVMMKKTFERPVLEELDPGRRNPKKNKIKEFAKGKGLSNVRDNKIIVDAIVGFEAEIDQQTANILALDPDIEAVYPDFQMQGKPIQQGRPIQQGESLPGDWMYDESNKTSDAINLIGGPSFNGRKSRIWILDTGVDGNHPDLKDNIVRTPGLAVSFIENGNPFVDQSGHGTHCAGIAAAKASNNSGLGMNGVSPGAPIIPIQVLGGNGEGSWINVLFALNHIAEKYEKKDVVMMSLGQYPIMNCNNSNLALTEAIKSLSKHVSIVMSAGNCNIDENVDTCDLIGMAYQNLPGCIDYHRNVYTVTAMDYTPTSLGQCADYAFLGSNTVDWIAPGTDVFSTFKNGSYTTIKGTSMACAIVAGIISSRDGGNPRRAGRKKCMDGQDYKVAIR